MYKEIPNKPAGELHEVPTEEFSIPQKKKKAGKIIAGAAAALLVLTAGVGGVLWANGQLPFLTGRGFNEAALITNNPQTTAATTSTTAEVTTQSTTKATTVPITTKATTTRLPQTTASVPENQNPEPEKKMPIQESWTEWLDTLPEFVDFENYEVEEQTWYRSKRLETMSSDSESVGDSWELYDSVDSDGGYGPWSEWSTTPVTGTADRAVEIKTSYRYRDLMTTTSQTELAGWELYNTTFAWSPYGAWSEWSENAVSDSDSRNVESKPQYRYRDKSKDISFSDWSTWSDWQDASVSSNDLTKVETRTVYNYGYFTCPLCGTHWHGTGFLCSSWEKGEGCGKSMVGSEYTEIWGTIPQNQMGFTDWHGTGHTTAFYEGERVFRNKYGDSSKTQYRYATRQTIETDRYSDWSAWSDTAYSGSSTREVVTRTLYRYRDRTQIPTYYYQKWSDWSGWSDNTVVSSKTRQIESQIHYRYCDKVTQRTYFFRRWTEWTEYSTWPVESSDTVQVETIKQYRYKSK